ncbi:MAG: methyltransferase [Euryarchaeota archaeon]|nr:methyltransferase [Euryarchaeota archaeon]
MKKKNLEIYLQHIRGFENPKPYLEQYLTPANVAAEILFLAYSMGDVYQKSVAELGAGTGIFTIGACALGAREIYSVEIDRDAIKILRDNIKNTPCGNVHILEKDVSAFNIPVDTIFQNTPFGSQNRHADLPFLISALKNAKIIYTLHNFETKEFLVKKIQEFGGNITHMAEFKFDIPRIYKFHRKEKVSRKFIFFRIESNRDSLK